MREIYGEIATRTRSKHLSWELWKLRESLGRLSDAVVLGLAGGVRRTRELKCRVTGHKWRKVRPDLGHR